MLLTRNFNNNFLIETNKIRYSRNYSTYNLNTLKNKAVFNFTINNMPEIINKCKGKSGVYALVNNTNGQYYIGSSGFCLYSRLRDYNQEWYLKGRSNYPIVRALLKYGIENFTILILEITTSENAVKAEQIWLDNFKPAYNILTQAGSSLGYKHTDKSKQKISESASGKTRSDLVRSEISKRQSGSDNIFFGKKHTEESKALIREAALNRRKSNKPGHEIDILDTLTGITETFRSTRKAAEAIGSTHGRIAKYAKSKEALFRKRYVISYSRESKS